MTSPTPNPSRDWHPDEIEPLTGGLRRRLHIPRPKKVMPGTRPGLDRAELEALSLHPQAARISLTVIDYSPDRVETYRVTDFAAFLTSHREPWVTVRWIDVHGLSDPDLIEGLAHKYQLHKLAMEDVVHVPQRPKAEAFEAEGDHAARLFVVMQMMQLKGAPSRERSTAPGAIAAGNVSIDAEQISMFLGHATVLTFQQREGDVWGQIRDRINLTNSLFRKNDASYLIYALIDAMVDHYFPILEHFGDQLEMLETRILQSPEDVRYEDLMGIRRELMLLRRQLWPTRELVADIMRLQHECFSEKSLTYMRDVLDHATQTVELVDTYREVATGLAEALLSSLSHRMNEVMKVLTMIATIFIPITFIAGVYGMNFEHMPELGWRYSYFFVWGLFILIATAMLWMFRQKRWI